MAVTIYYGDNQKHSAHFYTDYTKPAGRLHDGYRVSSNDDGLTRESKLLGVP